jgi:acylphosphatase
LIVENLQIPEYPYIKKQRRIFILSLKQIFKNLRDNYVRNQAQNAVFPTFPPSPSRRLRVRFSGRVQKVGFRLETYELAKRLELTGFCQNLENGDVLAELQGPENQIHFLISFMESLKRIKIKHKEISLLDIDPSETKFLQL